MAEIIGQALDKFVEEQIERFATIHPREMRRFVGYMAAKRDAIKTKNAGIVDSSGRMIIRETMNLPPGLHHHMRCKAELEGVCEPGEDFWQREDCKKAFFRVAGRLCQVIKRWERSSWRVNETTGEP